MKEKENFFNKIVKKDYNNELEKILEEKNFNEDVKSTLLSIFYKIEAAYPDVITVKQDIETKEEYLKNLIQIIREKCDKIEIIKMNSPQSKKLEEKGFLIDLEERKIISYPIERKLLYAICEMGKRKEILKKNYFLLSMTISDLINKGSNINKVEPIRDFNGYSWTTISEEIESIEHNLIYQNLRILLGHQFLNQWISNTEFMIDYWEKLQHELQQKYGKEKQERVIFYLARLSVLLEIKYEENKKEQIFQWKQELEQELEKIENKSTFISQITKEKQEILNKIKEIDIILKDKTKLQQEYTKRNEELPLQEKIFSMRILSDRMIREREKHFNQIEKLDAILNPQNFISYQKELESKYQYLKNISIETIEKEIKENLEALQKEFLECFKILIQKTQTKQEFIKLLYEYRYYNKIPYTESEKIEEVKEFQEQRKEIIGILIQKANTQKILTNFSSNPKLNQWILEKAFQTRIIRLEDLSITISKEKDQYCLQLAEENLLEEKIEIKIEEPIEEKDFLVKRKKKTKLLN